MEKPSIDSKRIGYIDIAKGIGILLVVLAHSDLALISAYLHKFIYSFHVPLFFFLSGYFFNAEVPLQLFIKKRFNAILKPYLFTILLIYLAFVSFTKMSIGRALGRILKSMYATGEYIEWIPLWFLPSLFVTSLFSYFFYRLLLTHINNRIFRWSLLIGLLALGLVFIDRFFPFRVSLLGKDYELFGLPYSLDIVLLSSFFYMFGSEIRKFSLDKIINNKLIFLIIGGALISLNAFFSQRTDLAMRIFDSFFINTVEALLGIFFILASSIQIETSNTKISSVFKYIGQASLFILIFHGPIQEFWGAKIFSITDIRSFSILSGFVISILISLGIYKIFVEQNRIALFWFGRISSLSQKNDSVMNKKITPK
ncbi:MAG: acyltransferase family protein [Anaerolineae bacterium]|nr:acyltransferase family protein [Anaerolineae bacterium]